MRLIKAPKTFPKTKKTAPLQRRSLVLPSRDCKFSLAPEAYTDMNEINHLRCLDSGGDPEIMPFFQTLAISMRIKMNGNIHTSQINPYKLPCRFRIVLKNKKPAASLRFPKKTHTHGLVRFLCVFLVQLSFNFHRCQEDALLNCTRLHATLAARRRAAHDRAAEVRQVPGFNSFTLLTSFGPIS